MHQEFLDTPKPESCVSYGPRLYVKFSLGQVNGGSLYRRLCELCCWGGEDRSYYPLNKQEMLVVKSFEFPFIPIQLDDDDRTKADRMNYHHAVDALIEAGYRRMTGNLKGHTEFFKGF